MSLQFICFLIQVDSVLSQSTLLDRQCDYECRNDMEIQRLIALINNMERIMKDTNERSEKKLMELVSKLDSQKTSFDNRTQELDQKMKTQKHTTDQLLTKVSELESKIQTTNVSEDCEDVKALGYQTSGVYVVNAENGQIKRVFCEMPADGGAWTRILHRQDNLTDFTYKKWAEYEAGFGDPQGSHWMGLAQMYHLTTSREYKMRVDLMDWEGETAYAEYLVFRVGPALDKYRLTISDYTTAMSESMIYHSDEQFTTIDQDNDKWSSGNCADGTGSNTGGWWYYKCFNARLTGTYFEGGDVPAKHGIQWRHWKGDSYSYKVATMKIQRL